MVCRTEGPTNQLACYKYKTDSHSSYNVQHNISSGLAGANIKLACASLTNKILAVCDILILVYINSYHELFYEAAVSCLLRLSTCSPFDTPLSSHFPPVIHPVPMHPILCREYRLGWVDTAE